MQNFTPPQIPSNKNPLQIMKSVRDKVSRKLHRLTEPTGQRNDTPTYEQTHDIDIIDCGIFFSQNHLAQVSLVNLIAYARQMATITSVNVTISDMDRIVKKVKNTLECKDNYVQHVALFDKYSMYIIYYLITILAYFSSIYLGVFMLHNISVYTLISVM